MAKNIVYSYVPDHGWTAKGFDVEHAPVSADQVTITCAPRGKEPYNVNIKKVECADGRVKVDADDFGYKTNWTLQIGDDKYQRADMDKEWVEGIEGVFEPGRDGNVLYRLYSPEARGPRPMIVFLHGGGNGGTDNITHLASDYGPSQFAQKYPDFYVFAPQAVERGFPAGGPGLAGGGMKPPAARGTFASSDMGQTGKFGWCREYLAEICDVIRRMIDEGKVDRKRVYVTGMSMGGAGTLRAMSVGVDLFAAAAPVCPTMTPETFNILKGLTNAKLWLSTSYVDHTIYRHKYIVDGVMSLRDAGNNNVHLTLYSPEELAKYDIATEPGLSYQELFSQNHMSWVPTYHDEYGIMSWLTEQTLD